VPGANTRSGHALADHVGRVDHDIEHPAPNDDGSESRDQANCEPQTADRGF
jgi:hypothetical protein